jgi:tetrahydromethanopterin S-methyltransferase subunit F
MDMAKNGLRFDLTKFNQWTKTTVTSFPSTTLPSLNGGVTVYAGRNKVALLLLPDHVSKENAMFEQKIDTDEVVAISISEIISKDDPDKLVEMILTLSKQLRNEKKRNSLLLKGLIVTTIIGFLIGLIF